MTPEEFEHIANKLRPKLKSIGRDFFSDRDMADDVAQEVLMRLWIMRERIDVRLGVEALASRMAKNICVSEWRKRKTRLAADMSAPPPDSCRQPTAMEDSDNRRGKHPRKRPHLRQPPTMPRRQGRTLPPPPQQRPV